MHSKQKYPINVRSGSVCVKIYRQPSASVYTVSYYEGEKRQRISFSDLGDAPDEANAIAERLARGEIDNIVLKNAARVEYLRAKEILFPVNLPLDTVAHDYVQALSILDGKGSLIESARGFASIRGEITPKRTADLVVDLIEARKRDGSSKRHIDDLKSRLNRFAETFQCEFHRIRPAGIQDFLLSLDVAPRTQNNYRVAISNLISHAKLRGCAPVDFDPRRITESRHQVGLCGNGRWPDIAQRDCGVQSDARILIREPLDQCRNGGFGWFTDVAKRRDRTHPRVAS